VAVATALVMMCGAAARGQGGGGGAESGSTDVGYIDPALIMNQFRFRFDASYDDNRPDRAEFFYSQYREQEFIPATAGTPSSGRVGTGANRGPGGGGGMGGGMGGGPGGGGPGGPGGGGPGGGRGPGGGMGGGPGPSGGGRGGEDVFVNTGGATVTERNGRFFIYSPQANGLPRAETRIDYQDFTAYFEAKATNNISGFVELPVRLLNPEVNANADGFADMNAGAKWAFWQTGVQTATLQLRTYIPTGPASRGLGTNHASLEPALLYNWRLTDRLTFEGELRDWIPIGGTDFEGNVLRYGTGLGYRAWQNDKAWVAPVVEVVGWNVLGGKETAAISPTLFEIKSAAGDTIVNLKMGVRAGFGANSDLYLGYGRALTGTVWYKDTLRVEYRWRF
jgi:hypothetical protein